MRLAFLTLLVAALVASTTARSDDFERGVEAYERGDHTGAWLRFWAMAQQGNAAAQFNLAQLYRQGLGIERELTFSRYWYEAAARQGHALAQYSLGVMHERGDGVPTDPIAARAWYSLAASQNVELARRALQRLDRITASNAPR
ncbi:MAG: SEL1-like repeat protein [Proteobacteria bacterium]|nr:SEL1-like repeat protein [Pseudomonadota bacterium]